jgi:chromosome segregation and condensation protein ScpB
MPFLVSKKVVSDYLLTLDKRYMAVRNAAEGKVLSEEELRALGRIAYKDPVIQINSLEFRLTIEDLRALLKELSKLDNAR